MRRDELVDGAWYCLRNKYDNEDEFTYDFHIYCDTTVSLNWPIEFLYEKGFEWARINPEEIFKDVTDV